MYYMVFQQFIEYMSVISVVCPLKLTLFLQIPVHKTKMLNKNALKTFSASTLYSPIL